MNNSQNKTIVVSGACGFIGSNLVHHILENPAFSGTVISLDKLSYAGNLSSLAKYEKDPRHIFVKGDILDHALLADLFAKFSPSAVMHLAAESHVDRSIDGPAAFIETNIVGTYTLLEAARTHFERLPPEKRVEFRFLHVSTDEVYGSLGATGLFREDTPYDPGSPYSASKASADHLAMAWHHTYGLPVIITNCSNNYGPFHFPEKLIPLTILKCLDSSKIPVYGKGDNVRDWLYVGDHVRALCLVLERGRVGETYNVGGNTEKTNLEVVHKICDLLDSKAPEKRQGSLKSYRNLISFVADRPGHDKRYAIDSTKLMTELGWRPLENFDSGMDKTVQWFLDNESWWKPILDKKYSGERLGTGILR